MVDSPLSEDDVRAALRASLEEGGWIDPRFCPASLANAMVDEALMDMSRLAESFGVGSVVRRRLSKYAAHFPVE